MSSHEQLSPTEEHKDVVYRYAEEFWNEGNLEVADELLTADCLVTGLSPEGGMDRDGLKAYTDGFLTAVPDFHVEIHEMIGEANDVVARWTVTGTHEGRFPAGPLAALDPTGKEMTVSGMKWFHFEDGKIATIWTNSDQLGMLQQLGAMPAQPPQ